MATTFNDRKFHIACVGESICYGSFAEPVTTMSYQAQLQRMLGDQFEVHDYSASGSPFLPEPEWPWARQGYIGSKQGYQSTQDRNDIILILLGNNDSKERVWNAPTGGETNFRDKVKELIAAYRALDTDPLICILLAPPAFPEGTPDKKLYRIRDEFVRDVINPILIDLAEELNLKLIDLRSIFPNPYTESGFRELEALYGEGDGVHPNNEGYTRIAQKLYDEIMQPQKLYFYSDAQDVVGMPAVKETFTFGEIVRLPEETPRRTGYDFVGWAYEPEGRVLEGNCVCFKGRPIRLYAVWEKELYFSVLTSENFKIDEF